MPHMAPVMRKEGGGSRGDPERKIDEEPYTQEWDAWKGF